MLLENADAVMLGASDFAVGARFPCEEILERIA